MAFIKFQIPLLIVTLIADIWAHLGLVSPKRSSPILVVIVVKWTSLQVVILWVLCALFDLKIMQV